MSGELIPFPHAGRMARAIVIVPDGAPGSDLCRAMLGGFPLDGDDETLSFHGPLWHVLMMAKDNRRGLPILVHDACKRRAGQ